MNFHLSLKKFAKARFYVGIMLVGLIFAIGGAIFAAQPKANKIPVEATVISVEKEEIVDETTNYLATISYTDQNGISHTYYDYPVSSDVKAGDKINVCYDEDNPELVSSDGGEFLPYILIAVGAVVFLFGGYKTFMIVKTPLEETNDFNKVDMTNVSQEKIDAIRNSDEPSKEYYFHFTGKLNQGYILETPDRAPVFEAVSQKLALFTKFQFNFINHLTHREEMKEVTHTVSTSYGNATTKVMTDSNFKINGVNCWRALGELGYSLEPHLSGLHVTIDVKKYGVSVATMESAGANVATGKNYKLGNIPTKGVYTVRCRESDIEGVFLACFITSRTYQ